MLILIAALIVLAALLPASVWAGARPQSIPTPTPYGWAVVDRHGVVHLHPYAAHRSVA